MDKLTDKHLFNEIKRGNKKTYEYCYKRNFIGLYYYAKKFVSDSNVAKDLVQECFLKVWENRENITIQNSFTAYLYKMVHNHALNYLKHRLISDKIFENQDYENLVSLSEMYSSVTRETGQTLIIANEFEERINKAVENLPQKCKLIFKLSRYEEMKNHEIANKLNISLNTVQKQISIALKKLREELSDILI